MKKIIRIMILLVFCLVLTAIVYGEKYIFEINKVGSPDDMKQNTASYEKKDGRTLITVEKLELNEMYYLTLDDAFVLYSFEYENLKSNVQYNVKIENNLVFLTENQTTKKIGNEKNPYIAETMFYQCAFANLQPKEVKKVKIIYEKKKWSTFAIRNNGVKQITVPAGTFNTNIVEFYMDDAIGSLFYKVRWLFYYNEKNAPVLAEEYNGKELISSMKLIKIE